MTNRGGSDHVDEVLAQWRAERPDLDVSPMAVIGRLSVAARLVEEELARTFADHDLDAASFDVLATLRRSGAPYQLTPTELMRSAMITSGAISQRLHRLETRGYVTRTPSSADRRGVQVTLTDTGAAAIDAALPHHLQTENRILTGLTPQQRTDLTETLHDLIHSLAAHRREPIPT